MRIRDWSSDVCSSDLIGLPADGIDWAVVAAWANVCETNGWTISGVCFEPGDRSQNLIDICAAGSGEPVPGGILSFKYDAPAVALDTITEEDRSEEHTSDLQSLMRHSSAVFCLKKNKPKTTILHTALHINHNCNTNPI